ncbi:PucR family transcriptional regulator [Nonomuraea endophytica]|uniref:PucR family transcriptional regulator n=1 Tax=Nonomuraea endophytica TaxID=714136 RepID=UPI0037CBB710
MPDLLVARLAKELLDELPELAERMFQAIVAEDETYALLDAAVLADVRDFNERNLRDQLTDMAGDQAVTTELSRETARRRAAQGVPLEAILHAYRIGFRVVWQAMVERATEDPDVSMGQLANSMTFVWSLIDAYSVAVTASYRETVTDLARRDERKRLVLLDALIEGRSTDWTTLGGTPHALGLAERGPYVCVLTDAGAGPKLPAFRSVWRLRTEDQVGIVSGDPNRILAALTHTPSGRTGVSPPFALLTEVPMALRLATIARAAIPVGGRQAMTVDRSPVRALLAASPELSERLVTTALGPLIEHPELLEALSAWLDTGGSTSAIAERLYCHRNTIRNRLDRVQHLTGRSLDDPGDIATLYAAVWAHRLAR